MTIQYSVSQDGLQVKAFPKGVLDTKETIDYFVRLSNDKKIKPGATEIVYFNHVTDFNISYLECTHITESYQKPKSTQALNLTIFVCESDLAYGIGRMLQTLHEITNPNHQVMLVRSDSEIKNLKQV